MKIGQVFTDTATHKLVDYHDLSSLTEQLVAASDELSRMSDEVAKARTIREFSSDRRKRSLAVSTREFLDKESAAAAEVKGRASVLYGEALEQQQNELYEAERTVAKYEATRIKWESLRSALSTWKAVSGNV